MSCKVPCGCDHGRNRRIRNPNLACFIRAKSAQKERKSYGFKEFENLFIVFAYETGENK